MLDAQNTDVFHFDVSHLMELAITSGNHMVKVEEQEMLGTSDVFSDMHVFP